MWCDFKICLYNNRNVDIKFSAHHAYMETLSSGTFQDKNHAYMETLSSGTFQVKSLEDQII